MTVSRLASTSFCFTSCSRLANAFSADQSANASAYSKASLKSSGVGFRLLSASTCAGLLLSNAAKRFSNSTFLASASLRALVNSEKRFSNFGFCFFSSVPVASSSANFG